MSTDESASQTTFRIGDLAREFGVTLRTLRYYEDRGLIQPERRGTTRIYSRRDRARLRLVLLTKLLGFSLTEAKQMIELYGRPGGKKLQLETALERFEEQRQILEEQRAEIEQSLAAMEIAIRHVRGLLDKMDGEG
ncbi:MerR family transcriptional regulator [Consotaella salsifontis]|uniref:MerR family transcriptional regulator n=1 Tax=Consotaella salsifontis TaxID=1365950 RepID=UPI002477FA31|nr:MerR family DNA-binding transcriptional regulator [Consotaella salsifontis]